MGIAQYNKKGMYNGYDKNNKEREALDYYSTPTEEVENILSIIKIDGSILEPCAGGGHMLKGIYNIIPDANVIDYLFLKNIIFIIRWLQMIVGT